MRKVDVAIIGAGSAGLSARREVAKKTDNYIVIDNGILGTTCARVGCMPSKVLIQAANDFHRRLKLKEEGILGGESLSVDLKEVLKHVRKLRDRFVRGVSGGMESWANDTYLIRKKASFVDEHILDLDGEKVWAKKIIIATGSSPTIPEELKGFEKYLLTTDFLFEQEDLPKNIAVLGLGVIGIELGQALHRLGLNVLGIARREIIAGASDPEIRTYIVKKMNEEMNLSFTGITSVRELNGQLEIKTKDKEILADKILVTTGRKPNLDKLNIEVLKCETDKKGIPLFCNKTFKLINHDHIFLVGDVTNDKPILHEASDEGQIAGYNSVRNEYTGFKTRTPLEITFSDPNIAFTGLKYHELVEGNYDFEVGQVSFEGQGRSIVKLKEIGILKVFGDKKTGELLGAEMFGPDNEHIAHLLSWVISQKMTVNKILALPFYHPVIEEGLRTALRDLRDKVEEEQPPFGSLYPIEI